MPSVSDISFIIRLKFNTIRYAAYHQTDNYMTCIAIWYLLLAYYATFFQVPLFLQRCMNLPVYFRGGLSLHILP